MCVTSISPCKHAYPDSLVCSVVSKLFFKENKGASGKRTTVSYFIILFRVLKNWHVNNYKNIMRLFLSVSQYKCQLTWLFRWEKKKKHKLIIEKKSCAEVCVTSISPCKHAHPDSLVCSVVNKLLFKLNRGASGKRTTVSYFIILFRFVRNWHVNNYKNIVRFVVSVSQYKCQLTSIFKRGTKKKKHKPITE